MKNNPVVLVIICCTCAIIGLCMSPACATDPSGGSEAHAIITTAVLNVTNASLVNATIPEQYKTTLSPLEVGIHTNNTLDGGLKGEMAAVPRIIGFSNSPEMVVIVIVVIAALGIGAWYFLKRKQNGENKE